MYFTRICFFFIILISVNVQATPSDTNKLKNSPPSIILLPISEVYVEAGNYYVGDVYGDHDYEHHTNVTLNGFYISQTEITFHQYKIVRVWASDKGYDLAEGCNGSQDEECLDEKTDNAEHPVTYVDWWDAIIFANALSEMNGYRPVYYTANGDIIRTRPDLEKNDNNLLVTIDNQATGYRLPTFDEWQVAARGGKPALLAKTYGENYAGSNDPYQVAWGVEEPQLTHRVAQKQPNALGIYDMSGNVSEWIFEQSYVNNGADDEITMYLFCGGDLSYLGANLSSCDMHSANYALFNIGIRLIRYAQN